MSPTRNSKWQFSGGSARLIYSLAQGIVLLTSGPRPPDGISLREGWYSQPEKYRTSRDNARVAKWQSGRVWLNIIEGS